MEIFEKILAWFLENLINIALVIVGATAFITYILDNKRKVKTAATLIVKQIDEIENAVKGLATSEQINGAVIYKSKQILSENYWQKYRHLFLDKLKYSEYAEIEKFYSNAEEIEKSRMFLINESIASVNNKDLVYQLKIAEEIINNGSFNKINSPLITYYNTGESFLSNLPMAYLTEILRTYEKIVDSNNGINAYEKLKNISYLKKY